MCNKKAGKQQTCFVLSELPELLYTTPQKVCTRCCHGGEPASRFVHKLPKPQRVSTAKAKKSKEAVDVVAGGVRRFGRRLGFGGGAGTVT